jgi:hypothetical protein
MSFVSLVHRLGYIPGTLPFIFPTPALQIHGYKFYLHEFAHQTFAFLFAFSVALTISTPSGFDRGQITVNLISTTSAIYLT